MQLLHLGPVLSPHLAQLLQEVLVGADQGTGENTGQSRPGSAAVFSSSILPHLAKPAFDPTRPSRAQTCTPAPSCSLLAAAICPLPADWVGLCLTQALSRHAILQALSSASETDP